MQILFKSPKNHTVRLTQLNYMKLKLFLTTALMTAGAFSTLAEYHFLVHLNNAEPMHILVQDGMKTAMDNNRLIITSGNSSNEFALDDVKMFSYFESTSVGNLDLENAAPTIRISENSITVIAADSNDKTLTLHDSAGRLIKSVRFARETILDITGLNPGIYLLNFDQRPTVKILIK